MPHRLGFGLILVGGCFFSADYRPGTVTCREGPCPDGLACVNMVCVTPVDAAPPDMPPDMPDGPPPALTCVDPGTIALDQMVQDTTNGRMNLVTALCGGFTNVGLDAVYQIDVPAGTHLTVSIVSGLRKAYVLAQCQQSPATPSCLGNVRAKAGAPIAVTTTTQPTFIVVDDETAGASGAFQLRVAP